MIELILGLPGSGKSLRTTEVIIALLQRKVPVWMNLQLSPACPFYGHPEIHYLEVNDGPPVYDPETGKGFWDVVPKGVGIIIDEAHQYFDALDHARLPKGLSKYLSQHRKQHHYLVFVTQALGNIYNRIRRNTAQTTYCEDSAQTWPRDQKIRDIFGNYVASWFRCFRRTRYAGCELLPANKLGEVTIPAWEISEQFGWYETEQIVG